MEEKVRKSYPSDLTDEQREEIAPLYTGMRNCTWSKRDIRRRTRVVGAFPDGNAAPMLVCARLRHVAGTRWGNKKYLNMQHLEAALGEADLAGYLHSIQKSANQFAQNS